jgi:hypothetical protein
MSLKRCCCVSAMRNVRHREIDDVGSDAIKTTQDVPGKRSYIEQEKFGGCWSRLLRWETPVKGRTEDAPHDTGRHGLILQIRQRAEQEIRFSPFCDATSPKSLPSDWRPSSPRPTTRSSARI